MIKSKDELKSVIKGIGGEIIHVNDKMYVDANSAVKIIDELIFTHTYLATLINKIGEQNVTLDEVADFMNNKLKDCHLEMLDGSVHLKQLKKER